MNRRQQLLTDILRELNRAWEWVSSGLVHAREWTLNTLALLTGMGRLASLVLLRIIIAEVLIFLLFIPLHRYLLKKLHLAKRLLVKQVDEIIYLLAKAQYSSGISERELGGDPHMAMMKEMFKSWHFEYLDNIALIQENVGKVELLLRKQVVSAEQWEQVHKLQKRMKRLLFWSNVVGAPCTVFTLGLYKLFR